jgi:hypothetical protein
MARVAVALLGCTRLPATWRGESQALRNAENAKTSIRWAGRLTDEIGLARQGSSATKRDRRGQLASDKGSLSRRDNGAPGSSAILG